MSVTNSPETYNGSPQGAEVEGNVDGDISDIKYDGSSTEPTDVGTYAVTADFIPDDTDTYNNLNDASAGNFVINKADSVTTITCPEYVIYNGTAQEPCSVSVEGDGGLFLTFDALTPGAVYENNTNVTGGASVSYEYEGDSNHNGSGDSTTFDIEEADANIIVDGFSGDYDGESHGATGSATGVGEDGELSGLVLGDSFTNVPGGTANWVFTDETGNYNDVNGSVPIEILTLNLTITADTKGKDFGDSDPTLTYTVTSGSLVERDSFSGSLIRDVGEDVGAYAITQGTVVLNSNYNLTYESADLTIGPNTIEVSADSQTKVYGTSNPALTYQFTPALQGGDSFSGSLSRSAGENVGLYGISQGTLALSSNYNLSFTGNNLSITQAPITITADAKTKVYGTSDPVLTYQITSGSLVRTDSLSGSLARATGENVGTYAINQGTVANSNYGISYVGANLTITKADQSINFGPLVNKLVSDPDFNISGSATSGLTVSFGVSGNCSISGSTVHITGAGSCTVTASQAGDSNYNVANDVTLTFFSTNVGRGTRGGDVNTTTPPPNNPGTEQNNENNGNNNGNNGGSETPTPEVLGVSTETPPTPLVSEVLGAEKFIFTQFMKIGSTDKTKKGEVTELEKRLSIEGFYKGIVDGLFGKDLQAAIKAYQKANPSLKVDGVVGPKTRVVLNA